MRELHFGCMDASHGHRMIREKLELHTDMDGMPDLYLTIWRCDVLHTGGCLIEIPAPEPR